jgi:hypothetical protein
MVFAVLVRRPHETSSGEVDGPGPPASSASLTAEVVGGRTGGRPPSFQGGSSFPESKLEADLRILREQIASRPPARTRAGQFSRLALPAFFKCYRELGDRNPDAVEAGSAVVRVVFKREGAEGRVESATFLSSPTRPDGAVQFGINDSRRTLQSPLALQCILQALQQTRFPAPDSDREELELGFGTGGMPQR